MCNGEQQKEGEKQGEDKSLKSRGKIMFSHSEQAKTSLDTTFTSYSSTVALISCLVDFTLAQSRDVKGMGTISFPSAQTGGAHTRLDFLIDSHEKISVTKACKCRSLFLCDYRQWQTRLLAIRGTPSRSEISA